MKSTVVWWVVFAHAALAQTLPSSHFVSFEFGTKKPDFARSKAAEKILRSFNPKNMPDLKGGIDRLVTPQTQLVLLAENHEDGAGSIGYPALLQALDEKIAFDCVFFERDPKKSEERIQAIIDHLSGQDGSKSMLRDYAAAAEKLIRERPRLLLSFRGSIVPMDWTATDISETRILAFMLSRGRKISWNLVDDVSRIKPWVYWDIRRRNETMATRIAHAFGRGDCHRGLAVNGKKHLTGYLELGAGKELEIATPLQQILHEGEKINVVSIFLSTGREWEYSGLQAPAGLSIRWKIQPEVDLAVEREIIDASQSALYVGLSGEGMWPILLEEIPAPSRKSISPDPDHGRAVSHGARSRTVTQYDLMLGNLRSFDGVLYVR